METVDGLRMFEGVIGAYYLVFGVDGFLKKIPLPVPSERGLRFLIAIEQAGYILLVVKIIEIIVGLSWLSGFGGGLAWILFTPVWFNILAYHLWLNKKERALPVFLLLSHLLLAFKYHDFLLTVTRLGLPGL